MKKGIVNLFVKSILVIAGFTAVFIISSCPTPINEKMFQQVKDNIPPGITILSPTDGSSYAATVVVTGTVSDISTGDGGDGGIGSLSYEVMGTNLAGTITSAADGSFTFNFPTTNLSGSITVKITAEDWNNNKSDISLSLVDAGTGIPDFTVTPGNHEVTLTWNAVSLAESYTLHYTTNEGVPSGTYGEHIENISSPYTLKNLENGHMHVFLLQAHSSSGEDNWSALRKAIPLSHFSLVPQLRAEYKKIVLEWPEIPGTDDFYVLRSTQSDGAYSNIAGKITSNRYEDSNVVDNQLYFYKIVPSLEGSIESFCAQGMASIFPSEWINMKKVLILIFSSYHAAEVSGNYLYTTTSGGLFGGGSSAFYIKDISDPLNIVELGNIHNFVSARDIKVKMATVYLASSSDIRIIDVSDLNNPVNTITYTGCSDINGIDIVGDIIYVADGAGGLKIYDPADPLFPIPKLLDTSPNSANDVAVSNGYAYVSVGAAGVDVIDLSTNTIVTTCDTSGSAMALVVGGNYLYVADDASGLTVIDISSPSTASVAGICDTSGNAVDISLKGKYAYIADSTGGLIVIDISDPSLPFISGFDKTPVDATQVASDENTVCVIDDTGSGNYLELYQIDSNHPNAVVHDVISFNGDMGLAMNDKYIFAGDNNNSSVNDNIKIINLSTNTSIGTYITQHFDISRFNLIGNYLFFGSAEGIYTNGRLNILDVSKTPNLLQISHFDYNAMLLGEKIFGDYYYAVGDSGLSILDISNPESPKQAGYLSLPGIGADIAIVSHYAFVSSYTAGLQIVDISNAQAPVRKGSLSIPDNSIPIAANDKYAYIGIEDAQDHGRFQIVDITNPENPQLKGSINLDRYPTEMVIDGTYVYALSQADFLYIIDVSDVSEPVLASIVNLTLSAFPGIKIYGKTAYINTGNGVTLLNLTGGN